MISRIGNVRNYLENIARVLHVRGDGHENASWLASLVSALTPRPGEQLKHAPVLIFDEFNMQGEDEENIFFADSFARFVYEKNCEDLIPKELPMRGVILLRYRNLNFSHSPSCIER